ncbi:hypothetical protein [Wolbachia pipientis]|uniref:hypothetical protein n=1 Tax=Wolbachia pipientis TaxID=955 RepID=UPI00164A3F27|nr:hypothetical protein [Wolbachia pipientis]
MSDGSIAIVALVVCAVLTGVSLYCAGPNTISNSEVSNLYATANAQQGQQSRA